MVDPAYPNFMTKIYDPGRPGRDPRMNPEVSTLVVDILLMDAMCSQAPRPTVQIQSGLYLCVVRRIVFAWILLVSCSLSMGLLPLTLHLCCDEARCHGDLQAESASCCKAAKPAQPSCCATLPTNAAKGAALDVSETTCCDDVAFFNLAPFFSWGEGKLRLLPLTFHLAWPQHPAVQTAINSPAQGSMAWYDVHHPPAQTHLPVFLACRRLLI